MLEPITDVDLVDRVRTRLSEAILSGSLAPGDRLVETELASRLGVSRAPVRDALLMLEYDGLVTSQGRRGRFVAVLSAKDAWEVYTLRESLEVMAFELVVGKCPPPVITEAERMIEEMRVRAEAGDKSALSGLDVRFHRLICESSGHTRLMTTWESMSSQIGLLSQQVVGSQYDDLRDITERHRALLEAVRGGDVSAATRAIRQHIRSVAEAVIGELGGEPPDSPEHQRAIT